MILVDSKNVYGNPMDWHPNFTLKLSLARPNLEWNLDVNQRGSNIHYRDLLSSYKIVLHLISIGQNPFNLYELQKTRGHEAHDIG